MTQTPQGMQAIENRRGVRSAIAHWSREFARGSTPIRFPDRAYWDEDHQYWARFLPEGEGSETSFRTFLGIGKVGLVEVNVPFSGDNHNVQGVVARDGGGHRWLLHRGRLHPGLRRISSDEFAAVAGPALEAPVRFKSGETRRYFRVADLDAEPGLMRAQLGDFLHLCERVRIHYTAGPAAAAVHERIDLLERKLFAEKSSLSVRPAQVQTIIDRWHGDVVNTLAAHLKGYGLDVANGRIGRYGPDLYSVCQTPKLFEVKTDCAPAHVQQGVGQLFLYERLLGGSHLKVLVLPKPPGDELAKCLDQLSIQLLMYTRKGRKIEFHRGQLDAVAR